MILRHVIVWRRLDNGSKTTIVGFINRKRCEEVVLDRKKLRIIDKESLGFPKETMIFVHPNMCPHYSHLSWKCCKLKRAGLIHSTWQLLNGTIVLKETESSRYKKIFHEDELDVLFPGHDYENLDVTANGVPEDN